MRPGDKLEEGLIFAHETLEPTGDARLQRVKDWDLDAPSLDVALNGIAGYVQERNLAAVLAELSKLVPEYQPSETVLGLLDPSLA